MFKKEFDMLLLNYLPGFISNHKMQLKRLSVDIGIIGLILTLTVTWKRNIWRAIPNKNSKHAT